MAIYRIFTIVNYAETSRDTPHIVIKELGYIKGLKNAKEFANKYIKENFWKPEQCKLRLYDKNYIASECCSWPRTIIVEKINIISSQTQ